MKPFALLLAFTLSHGALASEVNASSPDTYVIDRPIAKGSEGLQLTKSVVYAQAHEFCGQKELVAKIAGEAEKRSNGERTLTLEFKCITKDSRPPISTFFKK